MQPTIYYSQGRWHILYVGWLTIHPNVSQAQARLDEIRKGHC